MKAPYFTVLIDAYNYGEYSEEAVSSALSQDFPSEAREILVVDDGSTDDTHERLRKYEVAIRYLRKPNGGQASAFNFGFEHARGEVIALLDADDVWLPAKLRRVHEEFERHPEAGMVYHRVKLWNGISDISEDTYFIPVSGQVTENRRTLLQYPMVGTSCVAFRREALQKLLPVPESLLFQANAERVPHSQIERKMAVREALLVEIRNWLQKRGENVGSREIRAYLKQWVKAQESDGFALRAPGRWKYFRHLIDFPGTYGEIMTRRHCVYSYLRAFAALFLGYHHLHVLDDMRLKRRALFTAPLEKRAAAEKEKALAARG